MAWTIEYTATSLRQLKKIDKSAARRILDFMDQRVATSPDPRNLGKPLAGPRLGKYWCYRVGSYRVICDIQDGALRILVIELGTRGTIYQP